MHNELTNIAWRHIESPKATITPTGPSETGLHVLGAILHDSCVLPESKNPITRGKKVENGRFVVHKAILQRARQTRTTVLSNPCLGVPQDRCILPNPYCSFFDSNSRRFDKGYSLHHSILAVPAKRRRSKSFGEQFTSGETLSSTSGNNSISQTTIGSIRTALTTRNRCVPLLITTI